MKMLLKLEVMATQHCKCTKSHKPYTLKWLKWWLYVVWILPSPKKITLKKPVVFQLRLLSTFLSCAGLVREAWVPYPVLRHGLCIYRLNPAAFSRVPGHPPRGLANNNGHLSAETQHLVPIACIFLCLVVKKTVIYGFFTPLNLKCHSLYFGYSLVL